jgi:homocysteine S-methyltransferase
MRIHDGAYGTLLQHHLHGDETVDDLCLREPALVVDAHRAYLDAGAGAVQTNAFLAHLRGSSRRRRELRAAAVACAREAGAPVVLATIGPAGDRPRDFWEAVEQALEHEVDGVLCETVTSRAVADAFCAAWSEVAAGVQDVEALLGCSTDPLDADAARWVVELAADAPEELLLGLNCCSGPAGTRALLERVCEQRGRAFAMPSAGLPPYLDANEWARATLDQVADLPLVALGGCCGTTPASIAALHAGS